MAAERVSFITPEEYLAWEKKAETKSEYVSGEILAMAGASPAHNRISVNVTIALGVRLRASGCQVHNSDQRVRVADAGPFYYPDVSASCGDPIFDDDDCLRNPLVIIEVLSPSTEHRDRGEKFFRCRRIATLREYVLIHPTRVLVEQYTRQEDERWLLHDLVALGETLTLESVNAAVPLAEVSLAEIYQDVPLPESEESLPT